MNFTKSRRQVNPLVAALARTGVRTVFALGGADINLITGAEASPHITQNESSVWGHGKHDRCRLQRLKRVNILSTTPRVKGNGNHGNFKHADGYGRDATRPSDHVGDLEKRISAILMR